MNDLFQYFTFIGDWKRWSPLQIITLKRKLDRDFHSVAPLFEPGTHDSYREFMRSCFETFGPWGSDALLRTSWPERMTALGDDWDLENWPGLFYFEDGEAVPDEVIGEIRVATTA